MKYAVLFLTLGPALIFEAVTCRGLYWLLVWPGISLTLVGLAYLRQRPGMFGKRAEGTMAWYSVVPLLPYLLAAWAIWHAARIVGREDCCNEAAPGLFVGRRPRGDELPSGVSLVVDLTAEFIECRAVRTGRRYISAPMLDTGVMDEEAFLTLVREVAEWTGAVYVHCAQGHGRTGTLAAAVLLAKGHCDSVDAAVARLRATRPRLSLSKAQLQFVHRVCERLLLTRESASNARPPDSTARDYSPRDRQARS
jgi:protein-tyrosine phosphatase